ncbi:MAG: 50S ribosomal protein L11 methyltransferase [Lysobacter sp.]|nr:50S ribosomal protein L11 methyltransferase [Lysobacter sp.]
MLHTFLFPLLVLATAASAAQGEGARPVFVEEVPYVTTPDSVTATMLELAAVKAGDHVIDLGSGDGRIVIAAARRGATGLGVELDPRLVAESLANAKRAGVADRTRFLEQDLFETDLATATVVTMYLLPDVNLKLRPTILALRPGTRVVSHDWDMGDWKPDRSVTLAVPEKSIGLAKTSRVHLWIVPARVEGLWCGAAQGAAATLRLKQSYQFAQGEIRIAGASPAPVSGRIGGAVLALGKPQSPAAAGLRLGLRGTNAQTTVASGEFTALQGIAWRRARGDDCRAD